MNNQLLFFAFIEASKKIKCSCSVVVVTNQEFQCSNIFLCACSILVTYRLNKSETISTSVSAAAIFCSEESWGRPPKRKDMVTSVFEGCDYYCSVVNLD